MGPQNSARQSLHVIARDIELIDSSSFVVSNRGTSGEIDTQTQRPLTDLAAFLYERYYAGFTAQRVGAQFGHMAGVSIYDADSSFIYRLHEANRGEGYVSPGWTLAEINDNADLAVTKHGLTLWVTREQIEPNHSLPNTGEEIMVRMPKGRPFYTPGFYWAFSNCRWFPEDNGSIVRIYFNVRLDGAPRFVDVITKILNQLQAGFHLKLVNDPSYYERIDAAVLYFDRASFELIISAIRDSIGDFISTLDSASPLFTKPLYHGISIAEDPLSLNGPTESFGMNRCRLVAEGMNDAFTSGSHDVLSKVSAVESRFARSGVSLEYPYLNPGSKDIYSWN